MAARYRTQQRDCDPNPPLTGALSRPHSRVNENARARNWVGERVVNESSATLVIGAAKSGACACSLLRLSEKSFKARHDIVHRRRSLDRALKAARAARAIRRRLHESGDHLSTEVRRLQTCIVDIVVKLE